MPTILYQCPFTSSAPGYGPFASPLPVNLVNQPKMGGFVLHSIMLTLTLFAVKISPLSGEVSGFAELALIFRSDRTMLCSIAPCGASCDPLLQLVRKALMSSTTQQCHKPKAFI